MVKVAERGGSKFGSTQLEVVIFDPVSSAGRTTRDSKHRAKIAAERLNQGIALNAGVFDEQMISQCSHFKHKLPKHAFNSFTMMYMNDFGLALMVLRAEMSAIH